LKSFGLKKLSIAEYLNFLKSMYSNYKKLIDQQFQQRDLFLARHGLGMPSSTPSSMRSSLVDNLRSSTPVNNPPTASTMTTEDSRQSSSQSQQQQKSLYRRMDAATTSSSFGYR
jgi:hypothetical protein